MATASTTLSPDSSPPLTRLLTRSEVATFLRVGVDAIDRFTRRAEHPLPCRQAGRRHLFAVDEVTEWTIQEAVRGGTRRKPRRRKAGAAV